MKGETTRFYMAALSQRLSKGFSDLGKERFEEEKEMKGKEKRK